jgi:hypothetical protein
MVPAGFSEGLEGREVREGRGRRGSSLVGLVVRQLVGLLEDSEVSSLPLAHPSILLLVQPALEGRRRLADGEGLGGEGAGRWRLVLVITGVSGGIAGATEAERRGLSFGWSQGGGLIRGTGDLLRVRRAGGGGRETNINIRESGLSPRVDAVAGSLNVVIVSRTIRIDDTSRGKVHPWRCEAGTEGE